MEPEQVSFRHRDEGQCTRFGDFLQSRGYKSVLLPLLTQLLLNVSYPPKNPTASSHYQGGRLIYLKSNHNHLQHFNCLLHVFYKVVRLLDTWRRAWRAISCPGSCSGPPHLRPLLRLEVPTSMQATIFSRATAHIPPSSGNSPASRSHLTITLASSTPRSPRPLTRLVKQGRGLRYLIRKVRNGGAGP